MVQFVSDRILTNHKTAKLENLTNAKNASGYTETMFGSVREFSYLTAQKASVYRQIMRFFYLEHLSQRSTIPPESVLENMLLFGEVGYDLDQCLTDLDVLVEWGNLGRRRDQRRVASLSEYARRRDLYFGSSRGLSIEGFLESGLDASDDAVTVSAGVVVGIEERLKALDKLLEDDLAPEEIELLWREVHRYFLDLSNDTRILSANLERKLSLDDLDDFLDFKDVVKGYVERLARELSGAGRRIRVLLQTIPEYRIERLFEAVTRVRSDLMTQSAGVVGKSKARSLVQREFRAMFDWFSRSARDGDGLEYAIEALRGAISRVLAFVDAIHRTKELGLGRAGALAVLAENLAKLEDALEARAQLGRYVHIFAALQPIGEIPEEPVQNAWVEPLEFVKLTAVQKGRVAASATANVGQTSREAQTAAKLEMQRFAARQRELLGLFQRSDGKLDLDGLELSSVEMLRDVLTLLEGGREAPTAGPEGAMIAVEFQDAPAIISGASDEPWSLHLERGARLSLINSATEAADD
jgi:uncharacterized protein (TIGR02677 family)